MKTIATGLLALAIACAPLANAEARDSSLMTVLAQTPADEALWNGRRMVQTVDLPALRLASGLPDGIRLADLDQHSGPIEQLAFQMLYRLVPAANFIPYLRLGAQGWPNVLGFDLMEADWFSEVGTMPTTLMMFGGERIPRGAGLAGLETMGFAAQEHEGVTVWVKGDEDHGIDVEDRNPGFPFWGHLGSSVRLVRGADSLVGARSWDLLETALAVERGEAESLADLPRFRLAAAALGDPALSGGAIMQSVLFDEAHGDGVLGLEPAEVGLPAYGIYAIADRQDTSGHQVILALTYDDAATAKQAAAQLAKALLSHRSAHRSDGEELLSQRFPGLDARPSVVQTEDGAAAVVRLFTPPEPGKNEEGRIHNRSRLYHDLYDMVMRRDIDFLTPRG